MSLGFVGSARRGLLSTTIIGFNIWYCFHRDSPYLAYTNLSRGKCLTFIDTEGENKFQATSKIICVTSDDDIQIFSV